MKGFSRRIYPSFSKFLKDLSSLLSNRKLIQETMGSNLVLPEFRERLILAVTGVNQCRYCLYAHSRQALKLGINQQEIRELSQGAFDQSPSAEIPALLFAQHWAESGGLVDEEARQCLEATYGSEKSRAIEINLRMIQIGNLLGNTFDYVLYRISFGRWGLLQGEKQREVPLDRVSP
jgi:AhpD family alkylhydroperoxidase